MESQCPTVFSHVWVRDPNKQVWAKAFLLLRDKKLYLSYKVQVVAKFLRSGKQRESLVSPVSKKKIFLIIHAKKFYYPISLLPVIKTNSRIYLMAKSRPAKNCVINFYLFTDRNKIKFSNYKKLNKKYLHTVTDFHVARTSHPSLTVHQYNRSIIIIIISERIERIFFKVEYIKV